MVGANWMKKGLDRKQRKNVIRPTSSSLLKMVDNDGDYTDYQNFHKS